MASYRLTSKAEEDLLDIWSYIAENSPARATKLIRSFHQHFTLLAENTQLGQARPDVRPGLRYFPVKRYLILYRQIPGGIEVLRPPRPKGAGVPVAHPPFPISPEEETGSWWG